MKWLTVTNTLTYHGTELIAAVESLMEQGAGTQSYKSFSVQ